MSIVFLDNRFILFKLFHLLSFNSHIVDIKLIKLLQLQQMAFLINAIIYAGGDKMAKTLKGKKKVYVHDYTTKNGKHVKTHYRSTNN